MPVCYKLLKINPNYTRKCHIDCEKCKFSHPTALHIHVKRKLDKSVSTDGLNSCKSEPTGNSTVAQTFGSQTGAGSYGILPILPVQVKARRGNKVSQTYAFLDNGSTSTFCTEALMRKLNLTGKRSKMFVNNEPKDICQHTL